LGSLFILKPVQVVCVAASVSTLYLLLVIVSDESTLKDEMSAEIDVVSCGQSGPPTTFYLTAGDISGLRLLQH
jgi:hypothetical protein